MKDFRKTVSGIDFEFLVQPGMSEYYYLVKAENINFDMKEKNGTWKINRPVPIWIMDIEKDLSNAIESGNDNEKAP
jgi:hypothetical protein